MSDSDLILSLNTEDEARKVVPGEVPQSSTVAEGNLDLPSFFSLLGRMLKIDNPAIAFAPAYPKYLRPDTQEFKQTIDNPSVKFPLTVTYRVVRREPASIGGDKQPFGTGFKERIPRERARIKQVDGTQVVISGQNFDNEIMFEVWSNSNFEAEKNVNWFEHYLRTHRGFLVDRGIGELLFMRRTEDQSTLNNRLEMRSLTFYVRTEELSTEDEVVLRNLEIRLGIATT